MKNSKTIVTAIVLYLISTGISFATFSVLDTGSTKIVDAPQSDEVGSEGTLLTIPADMPRDQMCPLNGEYFTQIEKDAWEQRRPLAVMVENSVDARPHSGIIRADVVYEAVAEGGVTRFMPVFYCDAQRDDVLIAPVRSVRTYFIDWASEYGETPLFGHVGGANCSADKYPDGTFGPCKTDKKAQAIEQLGEYGWRYRTGNDLDQFSVGAPTYIRKENRLFDVIGKAVATEHSVVASTEKLWGVGEDRGWTNLDPDGQEWTESFVEWSFKDGQPSSGSIMSISHDFWEGYTQYDVKWDYDTASNTYKRSTGGEPHLDLETSQQIAVSNVVVLLTEEIGPVDDLKHMLYETIGRGDALIFQDGTVVEAEWEKDSRTDRTIFTAKSGDEVEFTRGKIWISIISDDTEVVY